MNNRQLFLQHLGQTSEFPLLIEIERAEGIYMYGPDEKVYTDLIAGIGVSNVGHRHPNVVKALHDQIDKYMHVMVYGEFVQTPQVQLGKTLASLLPDHLNCSFLVNSGSEANEGAIKLAKRFTGRPEIISCHNAYHGSTNGALSITGEESLKANFRPLLPEIKHITFNDIMELDAITEHTAAFIMEPVQGEAGVISATQKYMDAVRAKCNQTGTLLIFDEVQCGAGRTGRMWAHEHYNVTPDIMTVAKGIGGGMPIGAFISSQEIMKVLQNDPILGHITTFGGHPVCSAAANACLTTLTEDSLLKDVPVKAQRFIDKLKHPSIKEIRHLGLMMAVEFESFDVLKPIIDKAIEKGVVTDWFLFNDFSMRIAPPLTITFEEIDQSCKTILDAITETLH